MKNKLLELHGIDHIIKTSFMWIIEDKVDCSIDFEEKIILGATISKEIINSKIINTIDEFNNNYISYNNIYICSIKFTINIEYSENSDYGKIKLLTKSFFKTFFKPLENFTCSDIEENILIKDFDLIQNKTSIYLCACMFIGLNEI